MPVILACPGSGKSYFCKRSKLWEDQDILMQHLHSATWNTRKHSTEEEERHYKRLDRELAVATKTHYIMGSLFWDFVPDAIVVIPDKKLRQRVAQRSDLEYSRVKQIEATLKAMAKKHKVRVFDTFERASRFVVATSALI